MIGIRLIAVERDFSLRSPLMDTAWENAEAHASCVFGMTPDMSPYEKALHMEACVCGIRIARRWRDAARYMQYSNRKTRYYISDLVVLVSSPQGTVMDDVLSEHVRRVSHARIEAIVSFSGNDPQFYSALAGEVSARYNLPIIDLVSAVSLIESQDWGGNPQPWGTWPEMGQPLVPPKLRHPRVRFYLVSRPLYFRSYLHDDRELATDWWHIGVTWEGRENNILFLCAGGVDLAIVGGWPQERPDVIELISEFSNKSGLPLVDYRTAQAAVGFDTLNYGRR